MRAVLAFCCTAIVVVGCVISVCEWIDCVLLAVSVCESELVDLLLCHCEDKHHFVTFYKCKLVDIQIRVFVAIFLHPIPSSGA